MANERDNLDRMIDGALGSYSGAEPLAGLEGRVLNRVRVTRARRWAFVWLAVMASVAMVGVGIGLTRRPVKTSTGVVQAKHSFPTAIASLPRVISKEAAQTPRRAKRLRPLPKLEQFPSPSPMTGEERALVAFVERKPEEAGQIFARDDEPLEIQPIQIPELGEDDGE